MINLLNIDVLGNRVCRRLAYAAVVLVVLYLCISLPVFSTKGEPREALVAVNMLKSGNWILPIDASGDMAYKPPMFHWLIALFSLPEGHVTEFTSRLPSTVALMLTMLMTAHFCAAVRGRGFGVLCAALAITTFEVLRAGTVARVDMVLTMFIVGAMYALYISSNARRKLLYLLIAVLCMGCGALTKGPVAIVLPLGAWWLWRLLQKDNFWRISGMAVLMLWAALIIPLLWYYAAWLQGGDKFLTLALEENFGRFLGTMSYDSHVKPLWYNFTSLLSGMLPWSFLMPIALLSKTVRKQFRRLFYFRELWEGMCPAARFATIAALFVFVFYCIPKSKRSVYLLPMYPFMAYGMGCYVQMLVDSGVLSRKAINRIILSVVALLAFGFAIFFPCYTRINRLNPDKVTAEAIAKRVPAGAPVYTFIPDRFARYYIIDFYLQGRLVSLLPSGQVKPDGKLDASMMRVPQEDEFYLLVSRDIVYSEGKDDFGYANWLKENNLKTQDLFYFEGHEYDLCIAKNCGQKSLLKITR